MYPRFPASPLPRFPASPLAADALFDIDSRFRARERRTPPVGAALSRDYLANSTIADKSPPMRDWLRPIGKVAISITTKGYPKVEIRGYAPPSSSSPGYGCDTNRILH